MKCLCSVPVLVLLMSTISAADPSATQLENWHHWRGPYANGRAADSATPPTEWSSDSNVAWVSTIRGEGTSTPIVWQDRVFVLSAEATDQKVDSPPAKDSLSKTTPPDVHYRFVVSCFDRNTGRMLWERVAVEEVPHEGHHPTHTYAAASPTTDGERLYASFGSRGIFAYSFSGELLWKVDLGDMKTRYGWGEAVTPVIYGSSLVVNWDQEEGSFITCLDAATGKPRWKTPRPEEVTSWNTPLVTEFQGKPIAVANGTHRVRAYDLETGQQRWACGGQTVNAIPSPIRFEDSIIAMSGYRGAMAVAIPLASAGDVSDSSSLVWKHTRGTPYVPSPVLSNNRLLFTGGNADVLTVLDAASGQPSAEPQRLSGLGSTYASPIAANGHLFFLGRDGTCVVLKDDASLQIVAVNRLGDQTDASPVAVGNQLILRSWTELYCLQAATP